MEATVARTDPSPGGPGSLGEDAQGWRPRPSLHSPPKKGLHVFRKNLFLILYKRWSTPRSCRRFEQTSWGGGLTAYLGGGGRSWWGTRKACQGPRSHRAPGLSPTRGERLALREPPCGPGGGPRLGEGPRKPQAHSPLTRREERQMGGKHQVRQSLGAPGWQGTSSP